MNRKGFAVVSLSTALGFLTSCTMTPQPLSVSDRLQQATTAISKINAEQRNPPRRMNYYEVLAHSLKYNLDYRIKLANSALQAGQLRLAEFMMFPALNATGSLYTRDNSFSSYGITSSGQPTDVLNTTPRTLRTGRMGLTWNILDFGVSYVKAKQQGQAVLIAEEEARKQTQQLAQDVMVAYLNVYHLQQMKPELRELKKQILETERKLNLSLEDKTIPKEDVLKYQYNLYEEARRLIVLKKRYEESIYNLKHLANLPLDQEIILERPPVEVTKVQHLNGLNFKKLDSITLVNRPEVSGQNYQERIARMGINLVLLQALPGINLNGGWNYNSNKFLINGQWIDSSVDAAWNLLNLASLPAANSTAKTKAEYERLKWMAIIMTVLTETRYACMHYQSLHEEYRLAKMQTMNAYNLYQLSKDRESASLESDQQLIFAKLRAMNAKMDENLVQAEMVRAIGELYLSAGVDILPVNAINMPFLELVNKIRDEYRYTKRMEFKEYVNITYAKTFGNSKKS